MALERQDIVTDDALRTIPTLTDQLTVLLTTIDQVKTSSKQFSDGLTAAPLPKLKTDTEGLTQAQVELAKVQTQIATTVAKNNDLWIANAQALKNAKDELKNSQATADSWTKQANEQNSSINKLTEALNKNRTAYSNLKSEQERHSKAGQDLLKTIQSQDKSLKELSDSMGVHKAHVGAYREEIEKLLPALRSVAPEAGEAAEAIAGMAEKAVALGPILAAIVAVLATFAAAVIGYFEHTAEGEEKLTVATTQMGLIWDSTLARLGDTFSGFFGAVSDGFTKLLSYISVYAEAGQYLGKEAHRLAEEEIKDIYEKSAVQLEANKLLFESRDKLNKSNEQRLEAVKEADKLLKEQSEREIKLAKDRYTLQFNIFKNEQAGNALTLEQRKELAELDAKVNEAADSYYQGSRRRQNQIITISREIITERIELEKQFSAESVKAAEIEVNTEIEANKKILNNANASFEDRLAAQRAYTQDEASLLGLRSKNEIDALHAERDLKINAASGDAELIAGIKKLYQEKEKNAVAEYGRELNTLLSSASRERAKMEIDNNEYFLKLHDRFYKEDNDARLRALNDSFNNGEISLVKYAKKKAEILRGGNDTELETQRAYYVEQVNLLKKYLNTTENLTPESRAKVLELVKQLEEKETQITEKEAEKRIKARAEEKRTAVALLNQLFATFKEIGDNQLDAQIQQTNKIIEDLNRRKDLSIKAAGDNKNAQLHIEMEFNDKIEAEDKKVRALERKKAQHDKDIAEAKVVIDVAQAIAKAYADYGYIAGTVIGVLLTAIGVAQLAAIDSAPLPSYEIGTTNHPGGPARVAEKGAEIVVEPGRKPRLYDVPNTIIPDLAMGSKVYNADDTRKILAVNMYGDLTTVPSSQDRQTQALDDSRIIGRLDRLAESFPDVISQAAEVYKVANYRNGSKKWIRSKISLDGN